MTTFLKEIVTVQEQRGDVLSPAEYSSIVASIKTIMRDKGYNTLNQTYQELLNHLVDFTNPHHDDPFGFRDEIINRVYQIYTLMTPAPLSKESFIANTVPSVEYIELILRILENQWLYDNFRTPLGRVNQKNTITYDPVSGTNQYKEITFDRSFKSQEDFIKSGWNAPTHDSVVETAIDLYPDKTTLPLISAPRLIRWYPLSLSSHSVTISIKWDKAPNSDTMLFTLGDDLHTEVMITVDNSLVILKDHQEVLRTDSVAELFVQIQLDKGIINVITKNKIYSATTAYSDVAPFDHFDLLVSVGSTIYSTGWGLQDLLFYQGWQKNYIPINLATPPYVAYMADSDGAPIVDTDGTLLCDYDVDVPEEFYLLVDDDEDALIDAEGNFILLPTFIEDGLLLPLLPIGFNFISDLTGRLVTDNLGRFLISSVQ